MGGAEAEAEAAAAAAAAAEDAAEEAAEDAAAGGRGVFAGFSPDENTAVLAPLAGTLGACCCDC